MKSRKVERAAQALAPRDHEKDHENFRVFQISCFRDCFYYFCQNIHIFCS
jgi:hypothetical protein